MLITSLGGGWGESELSKRGWKYDPGADLLKRVARGQTLFLFHFFKVYHFYIYKLLYLWQNCVMHLKKILFFSVTIIL